MENWAKTTLGLVCGCVLAYFTLMYFTTGTSETVANQTTLVEIHERDKADSLAEYHKRAGSSQATIEKYEKRAAAHDANVQADLAYAQQKSREAQQARDTGTAYAGAQLSKATDGAVTAPTTAPLPDDATLLRQLNR
ncbi:hypothetical protein [Quatrionicoccus australiensis]|uniref:hypothetical protein n=1 Tax=Quatrionicoccus australiensis TaxID=138118 RepID=UPI001CF9ED6A|nr:hypothetical protein [Quatrionicoccus australiensis]MCB4359589.1 hypothetical protein [Quatrionicoccus australiensis]